MKTKLMIKTIFFLVFFFYEQIAFGLVTCLPSSCLPACNSSCTYYTCSQAASHIFNVNQLPLMPGVDTEPINACAHSTVTSNSLSFTVNGIEKYTIPTSVTHNYTVCQAHTNVGALCATTCVAGAVNNSPIACDAGFTGTKFTTSTTSCPSGPYGPPSTSTSAYNTSGCSATPVPAMPVTCTAGSFNNPAVLCPNGFGTMFTTTTTSCPSGPFGPPSVSTSGHNTSGCLPSGTVVGLRTCNYTRPGCFCDCGPSPRCSNTWGVAWGVCTGVRLEVTATCGAAKPISYNCVVP